MPTIKCLTLHQPFASLIVLGIKKIETRSWSTHIRGEIGIHAAGDIPPYVLDALEDRDHPDLARILAGTGLYIRGRGKRLETNIPLGVVVGTATVVDCLATSRVFKEYPRLRTREELACGDFSPGRYGLVLTNPLAYDPPQEARGRQQFWNWDAPDEEG